MEIKSIRSNADYELALREIQRLWGAKEGTAEGDRLNLLATLVDAYETKHFPIDAPERLRSGRSRDR
jgi:HTH-type transcriptional regulator / antitoxin HigA